MKNQKFSVFYFVTILTWWWNIGCKVVICRSPGLATRLLGPNASYFGSILTRRAISRVHKLTRSCYKPCQKKSLLFNLLGNHLTNFFSRVLRDSISHFLVRQFVHRSVGPSVRLSQSLFKGFLSRFKRLLVVEKKLGVVKSCFKCLFEKKMFVCLSACLFFF